MIVGWEGIIGQSYMEDSGMLEITVQRCQRGLQNSGVGGDYRVVVLDEITGQWYGRDYRIVVWWGLQDSDMEEITGQWYWRRLQDSGVRQLQDSGVVGITGQRYGGDYRIVGWWG